METEIENVKKNQMKKITLLMSLVLLSYWASAQFPAPMPGKGAQAVPNIGHIYGKLTDSTDKPISDASIILI